MTISFLDFFGPLDKSWCGYFLIVSIIFFISMIILLFNELYFIVTNMNKLNFRLISGGIIILFNVFIAYFMNRLLYTMCTKSLA